MCPSKKERAKDQCIRLDMNFMQLILQSCATELTELSELIDVYKLRWPSG